MNAERKYEARLMRDGEEVEVIEATPAEIAAHFDLKNLTLVETACRWADEELCAQGIARGAVATIVIEPSG